MKKSKENRCQCCNTELGTDLHYIYDAEGVRQNIALLLFEYIGKKLNEDTCANYAICDSCYHQLIQCHEFKQKCIQANASVSDSDETTDEEVCERENRENVQHFGESQNDVTANAWNESGLFEVDDGIDEQQQFDVNDYGSDDMNVEYLEDSDFMDEDDTKYEANCEQRLLGADDNRTKEVERLLESKSLPFDFSTIVVKPMHLMLINDHSVGLIKVKQKIKSGIPRHIVELSTNIGSTNQNLDVQKIVTSDDLINILEDDYQSESNYAKRAREDGDVFKIPKIDAVNEIEYLNDVEHIDIDEYLQSIASITYDESYEHYINCKLCNEQIISQQHLIYHIHESHSLVDGSVLCIFDEDCSAYSDLVAVQEHIFTQHVDLIPTQLCLTCATCTNTFKSSVQFNKHMCLSIDDGNTDFQCSTCDIKLTSRKRHLFHSQFHLENARPKVCIICELTFQSEEKFYNHVMFTHERIFEHFFQICDKSFSSKFRLELHHRVKHEKRTIHCSSCDKTFVDKSMLDEHISSKHSMRSQTDKSFSCTICEKVYNRSSRLKKHMTTHETPQKSNVLICEKCLMAFANIEDIDDHFNRIHDEDDVQIDKKEILFVVCCEYCENAFIDFKKLADHKQNHLNDEKPFKCEYCMACYESHGKLKTHKNTHIHQQCKFPVQRYYMCDIENCWKRYRHWSDLLNHRKTVHLINPSIYKCSECEQTFYQSWNYAYHKKTAHCTTFIQCDDCDYQSRTLSNLRSHQKKEHPPDASPFKIKKAKPKKESFKIRKTTQIEQYTTKIDSENKLLCNLCGKHLTTRNGARSHIEMIHLKIRHHVCNECGKDFYLRKDYNDHVRLHTAETPYKCEQCERKFRTLSLLAEHRRSHTNERPHRCPYCVSTFKRAYVLKNHIKQHIGVKGFPCTFVNCTKEYRTQWELNSHQRRKHQKEKKSPSVEIAKQLIDSNTILNISSLKEEQQQPTDIIKMENWSHKPKIAMKTIYVLPGPLPNENTTHFGTIADIINEDDETIDPNIDHNYLS